MTRVFSLATEHESHDHLLVVVGLGVGASGRGNGTRLGDEVAQNGPEEPKVHGLCAASSRKLEPNNENALKGEVPGDIVQEGADGDVFDEVQGTKDDPVGEPLDVIIGCGGLDCEEREVGGQSEADQVGDDAGEGVDEVEEGKENNAADEDVSLGDLSALLQVEEDGIVSELFVELALEMERLLLGLDEHWVLLDFLGGGHCERRKWS